MSIQVIQKNNINAVFSSSVPVCAVQKQEDLEVLV